MICLFLCVCRNNFYGHKCLFFCFAQGKRSHNAEKSTLIWNAIDNNGNGYGKPRKKDRETLDTTTIKFNFKWKLLIILIWK